MNISICEGINTRMPQYQYINSISQMLSLMPENALVGVITFGTQVHVYELGFTECVKSFVFNGSKVGGGGSSGGSNGSSKVFDADEVRSSLGLIRQQHIARQNNNSNTSTSSFSNHNNNNDNPIHKNNTNRFLSPVSECEFHVTNILEELTRDPWPQQHEKRAVRYDY